MADAMVPSLERSEYMDELRNIADNIVKERLEHSEVRPVAQSVLPTDASDSEVASTRPQTPTNVGTSATACVSEVVQPSVEPLAADVGPAFHIPMTQVSSLEDLPNQLDFEWQDSVSANPESILGTARNLGAELEAVGTQRNTAAPKDVGMATFVEVSQIAQEAAKDATPQPPAKVPTSIG